MCESDPRTFGLDPGHLEAILKKERPAVVVVVHVLGVPADMTSIMALKKELGFMLLEDACASHGRGIAVKWRERSGIYPYFRFITGIICPAWKAACCARTTVPFIITY